MLMISFLLFPFFAEYWQWQLELGGKATPSFLHFPFFAEYWQRQLGSKATKATTTRQQQLGEFFAELALIYW